jgi:hypothetical protein
MRVKYFVFLFEINVIFKSQLVVALGVNRHDTIHSCLVLEDCVLANMADIENMYLMVPITEKVWTVLGPDGRADAGK